MGKRDFEKSRHVEMAAVAAVEAELYRRYNSELRKGYEVYMTRSNAPVSDLHCISPKGTPFDISVKGVSSAKTGAIVQGSFFKEVRKNLFLIIVEVPLDQPDKPFRFFILSLAKAKAEHEKQYEGRIGKDGKAYTKKGDRPLALNPDGTIKLDGLDRRSFEKYEGPKQWDKLPK